MDEHKWHWKTVNAWISTCDLKNSWCMDEYLWHWTTIDARMSTCDLKQHLMQGWTLSTLTISVMNDPIQDFVSTCKFWKKYLERWSKNENGWCMDEHLWLWWCHWWTMPSKILYLPANFERNILNVDLKMKILEWLWSLMTDPPIRQWLRCIRLRVLQEIILNNWIPYMVICDSKKMIKVTGKECYWNLYETNKKFVPLYWQMLLKSVPL